MKVFIIDSNIDDMGGVERIVNVLSNNLSSFYDIKVISEYKTKKDAFFKYDSTVEMEYLVKDINFLKDDTKFKHYFNRVFSILRKEFCLNRKIIGLLRTVSEDDTLIFGRVTVALDFLPFLDRFNMRNRVFVRDGTNLACYNSKTRRLMKKYFPNLVDTFIISSDESKNEYKAFFGKCKMKLIKIYNPLGIKAGGNYKLESKTIVSVGRICAQKGFDVLVDAFSIVLKKHQDWVLNIYGNGDLEKRLKAKINDLNISDNVFIFDSAKNIIDVYNESAIFVCSSRFEGYANALVEAGACGLPLISFNWLMGVEEIINNNKNGIIIELSDRYKYFNGEASESDIDNMAKAINRLIENEAERLKFSLNSKLAFRDRSLDIIIKKWVNLIDR